MRIKSWMKALSLGSLVALSVPTGALAQEEDEDEAGETAPVRGSGGGLRDTSKHTRKSGVAVYGILPWWYGTGIGAGARYVLPLVHDGFIPSLNDSFELEFGADVWYASWGYFGYSYSYVGLAIPAEARWSLHFTPQFTGYAKVGLGLNLNFWDDNFGLVGNQPSNAGLYWDSAVGALFHLNDSLSLRGELGYAGLRAGVAFNF